VVANKEKILQLLMVKSTEDRPTQTATKMYSSISPFLAITCISFMRDGAMRALSLR